jgi:hypothetical protein
MNIPLSAKTLRKIKSGEQMAKTLSPTSEASPLNINKNNEIENQDNNTKDDTGNNQIQPLPMYIGEGAELSQNELTRLKNRANREGGHFLIHTPEGFRDTADDLPAVSDSKYKNKTEERTKQGEKENDNNIKELEKEVRENNLFYSVSFSVKNVFEFN